VPAGAWPPAPPPAPSHGSSAGEELEQIPAAVLVPLFLAGSERVPSVVLTKRRADLRRHAGEISFPGGRRDAADATLLDTALREAEEEIGLPPANVTLLGELPPTSTFATRYTIHPFVGQIPGPVAWRLSAKEVDSVLELPLADIQAGAECITMERRGFTFEADAYLLDGHTIWGATARILAHLFERLAEPTEAAPLALNVTAP
jgi:8-oxo-dGTP pyrophosphatase MutT (NUDIX family)